jgi:hypothetical protein
MMKSEQTNIGWAIPGFQSHSIRRSNTDGKKFKAKTQPERTESTIEKASHGHKRLFSSCWTTKRVTGQEREKRGREREQEKKGEDIVKRPKVISLPPVNRHGSEALG